MGLEKSSPYSLIKDSTQSTYVYDSFGQLIRENNKALDKTFIYGYNEIGNIVSAKAYAYTTGSVEGLSAVSTDSYTYDATNKDRLTSVGGTNIPYNAMGCPSGYDGYIASWTRGKLSNLSKGFKFIGIHNYDYSYNALGQRVGISYTYTPPKSPGGSAVAIGTLLGYSKSYDYDQSGRLIAESRTNEYYGELGDSEKIVFLYDEAGMVGFVYTKSGASNTYYYDRNIRGDVIGIYDANGTRIVKYSYDAWGNCTIDSSMANMALAKTNPIRYRGYYYDEDTKLYCLNARYYCPAWRRFISPDSTSYLDPETPNGLNLYAYCNNDPVNYSDPSGHDPEWWHWVISGTLAVSGIALIVATAPISASVAGAAGIAATIGGILGGGMLAAGAGSIIGGYVHEKNGGSFNAGYLGGMVSGFITGTAAGIGGWALLQATTVSNLPCLLYAGLGYGSSFAGGFWGNYIGTKVTALQDNLYFDQQKTIIMSLTLGLLNTLAAYGSAMTSIAGIEIVTQTTVFRMNMMRILASLLSAGTEAFFDIMSYIAGVLYR